MQKQWAYISPNATPNREPTMTTYISLESIRRALRNHSTTLIWVNGVIERSA